MIEANLVPHPDHPPLDVTAIDASVWHGDGRWHFRFLLDGTDRLINPDPPKSGRADDLWKTTCFEAFVGGAGGAYLELNFSPSGQWAAYAFDGPRQGMSNADADVDVWLEGGEDWIAVEAAVSTHFAPNSPLGLTAVIEEQDARKSYWALAHPSGKPDFHDPSCFIARLPE
ncbi:MAG: DOMON-like domain-containing protein [Sphingomonas bacterium]|nr:DOMON-like domain-containing protein [Sphingomonas bacterium]